MTASRRKFTREFKVEACNLILKQHQGIAATSRNLGITDNILSRWVKAYREDPEGAFPGEGTAQILGNDPRIRELEKELKKTRLERDILKKAMAYFVESPK